MVRGTILGTFWIPNVAKKRSEIDPKNIIEKRWFQGGPPVSQGSRAGVQKEQLSKRFGYLEGQIIRGFRYSGIGLFEDSDIRGFGDLVIRIFGNIFGG